MSSDSPFKVFRGSRFQKGHGIASFFANLFRTALPVIKKGAKYLGKKAIRTGLRSARDIVEGEDPGIAFKKNFKRTGRKIVRDLEREIRHKKKASSFKKKMEGHGVRKKRNKKRAKKRIRKQKRNKKSVSRGVKKKKVKKRVQRIKKRVKHVNTRRLKCSTRNKRKKNTLADLF